MRPPQQWAEGRYSECGMVGLAHGESTLYPRICSLQGAPGQGGGLEEVWMSVCRLAPDPTLTSINAVHGTWKMVELRARRVSARSSQKAVSFERETLWKPRPFHPCSLRNTFYGSGPKQAALFAPCRLLRFLPPRTKGAKEGGGRRPTASRRTWKTPSSDANL